MRASAGVAPLSPRSGPRAPPLPCALRLALPRRQPAGGRAARTRVPAPSRTHPPPCTCCPRHRGWGGLGRAESRVALTSALMQPRRRGGAEEMASAATPSPRGRGRRRSSSTGGGAEWPRGSQRPPTATARPPVAPLIGRGGGRALRYGRGLAPRSGRRHSAGLEAASGPLGGGCPTRYGRVWCRPRSGGR